LVSMWYGVMSLHEMRSPIESTKAACEYSA
jgi:hypothetical protein